ncbi:MAG: stage sporulation protein, partial [Clostridia bacterium]|nr:stage sporulation protein [Clostridia bacterium]
MLKDKWWGGRFLSQKPPWYIWLAVGAFILGSVLMSIGNLNSAGKGKEGRPAAEVSSQVSQDQRETELMIAARELENQLQGILEKAAGAGRVAVRVSLKTSPLKEFATNTKATRHSIEEKEQSGGTRVTTDSSEDAQLVMARNGQLSGSEVPVVKRESQPEVLGVLVVAEGAGDPVVRARIIQAVQTLWGLAPHQV